MSRLGTPEWTATRSFVRAALNVINARSAEYPLAREALALAAYQVATLRDAQNREPGTVKS